MNEGELFRMDTAYTLSQYRMYNRTMQRRNHVMYRQYLSSALYILVGLLLYVFLDLLVAPFIFFALAVFGYYLTVRNMHKAEMVQYQREQLVGTVTYVFCDDLVRVTTHDGTTTNPYALVSYVLENSDSFYIMYTDNSGLIVPKCDMPEGLSEFIRNRFTVIPVKDVKVRSE